MRKILANICLIFLVGCSGTPTPSVDTSSQKITGWTITLTNGKEYWCANIHTTEGGVLCQNLPFQRWFDKETVHNIEAIYE